MRALGVALPYALTLSVFGGTTEYFALWLKQVGLEPWFFVYVSLTAGISAVVYWLMPDTRESSRIERDRANSSS